MTRKVYVYAMWTTVHEIEVDDDHPRIESLDDLLEVEDIDSSTAALLDWDITDDGPDGAV
jgi:hypothetical protein